MRYETAKINRLFVQERRSAHRNGRASGRIRSGRASTQFPPCGLVRVPEGARRLPAVSGPQPQRLQRVLRVAPRAGPLHRRPKDNGHSSPMGYRAIVGIEITSVIMYSDIIISCCSLK